MIDIGRIENLLQFVRETETVGDSERDSDERHESHSAEIAQSHCLETYGVVREILECLCDNPAQVDKPCLGLGQLCHLDVPDVLAKELHRPPQPTHNVIYQNLKH